MSGITDLIPGMNTPDTGAPAMQGGGCDMERLMALPIRDQYKKAFMEFCSNPENASKCQLLCDTSDEQLVQGLNQIERGMMNEVEQAQRGEPSPLMQGLMEQSPKMASGVMNMLQSPEAAEMASTKSGEVGGTSGGITGVAPSQLSKVPEPMDVPQLPRGYARGGLATLGGRYGDTHRAHVTKGEMVIPNSVLRQPGMRSRMRNMMQDSGVNPDRYTVGNRRMSINPRTGEPEFFAFLPILGAIAGKAIATSAGWSALGIAAAVGVGSAIGAYIETGDMDTALSSGLLSGVTAGIMGGAEAGLGGAPVEGTITTEMAGAGPIEIANTVGTADPSSIIGGTGPDALISSAGTGASASGIGLPAGATSITGEYAAGSMPIAAPMASAVGGAIPSGGIAGGITSGMATPAAITPGVDASSWGIGDALKGGWNSTPVQEGTLGGINKAAYWVGENPMLAAGGAALLYSAMNEEENEFPSDFDHYQSPVDKYNVCMRDNPNNPEKCEALRTWAYTPLDRLPAGIGGHQDTPAGRTFYDPQVVMPSSDVPPPTHGYYYGQIPQRYAQGGSVRRNTDTIPAYLTEGEFVLTEPAVRGAGNGSRALGAQRLYQLMDQLERRS